MKPSSHISWFIETKGATLCSQDNRICLSIPYPYAALWALFANGNYDKKYAVELVSVLMSVDKHEAEREVVETISAWIKEGILSGE